MGDRELRIVKRFDELCIRFGEARIGRVIRERILANRLWRAGLAQQTHELKGAI